MLIFLIKGRSQQNPKYFVTMSKGREGGKPESHFEIALKLQINWKEGLKCFLSNFMRTTLLNCNLEYLWSEKLHLLKFFSSTLRPSFASLQSIIRPVLS